MPTRRIVVAVAGASGSIYAEQLINRLYALHVSGQVEEVAIIFSDKGQEVWAHEIGSPLTTPFTIYDNHDFNAGFASGSSLYDTLIICPCSMGTMGRIANGIADTLITRAADVMLKERRRLILAVRETPFHLIHINNMQVLTQAGAIIAPASPSFYSRPATIDALTATVVDRLLQLAGLETNAYQWGTQSNF